jgi:hypothetical protein
LDDRSLTASGNAPAAFISRTARCEAAYPSAGSRLVLDG